MAGRRIVVEAEIKACPECGTEFPVAVTWKGWRFTQGTKVRQYCSDRCKVAAWRKKQAKGAR